MNRDEEKNIETKRWFFEKISKSDKPLVEIQEEKKGKVLKSIKLAMKKKKIQPTPQQYKGP